MKLRVVISDEQGDVLAAVHRESEIELRKELPQEIVCDGLILPGSDGNNLILSLSLAPTVLQQLPHRRSQDKSRSKERRQLRGCIM